MKCVVTQFCLCLVSMTFLSCAENPEFDPPSSYLQSSSHQDVIHSKSFINRTLIIDGVVVNVVKGNFYTKNLGHAFMYLIEFSGKQLSFRMSKKYKDYKNDIEVLYLNLLNEHINTQTTPVEVDVKKIIDDYRVLNALALGRCKSSQIYSQLRNIVLKPKTEIYFAINGISLLEDVPYLLKWNLEKKEFTELIEVHWKNRGTSIFDKEQPLLLSPNTNIYDKNNQLITSDAFLFVNQFRTNCMSQYSAIAPYKSYEETIPDDQFLPRYKEKFDQVASRIIDQYLPSVEIAITGPRTIGYDVPTGLSPSLVTEAKSTEMYQLQLQRDL